jgi:two-component system sensor histidine kinase QseC
LARSIARREPGHLQRVDTTDTPREIEPLVTALNQLFERVEGSMEHERRFTADAAHELRTPLAALKIQAQVALQSRDEAQRTHALEQVIHGVGRASRLVEQLLTLARIDHQTARGTFVEIALSPLAEETLATLEPLASARAITLQLQSETHTQIKGQADAIAVMLRNLTDNAIRYTPSGGTVELTIEGGDKGVQLSVADSGPGITEEERAKIFNRFYRLAGQNIEGSGLGLSIVQRIAELHRATITLQRSHLGGLEVRITFPGQNT